MINSFISFYNHHAYDITNFKEFFSDLKKKNIHENLTISIWKSDLAETHLSFLLHAS